MAESDSKMQDIPTGEVIEVFDFPAWLQIEGEPDEWYRKFVTYYLSLGPTRTLLKAFTCYVEAEYPKDHAEQLIARRTSSPNVWSVMAREWDWRNRAKEYDRKTYADAGAIIAQARLKIQMLTHKAVETLEKALEDPRLKVAASKVILDRGGLPATTVSIHQVQPFTADDYARAAQETEEWRNRLTNGTNG